MDKFIIRKKKSKYPKAEAGSASSEKFQEGRDGEDQPLTKRSRTDVTETTVLDQRIPGKIPHIPEKKKIHGENLDCDYMRLYSKNQADDLFQRCEESLEYFTGDLARIKVYGKWHDIPRKQVSSKNRSCRFI